MNPEVARLAIISALLHGHPGLAPIRPPQPPQHPSIPPIVAAILAAKNVGIATPRPGPGSIGPAALPNGIPSGLLSWLTLPNFYESGAAPVRNSSAPTAY